MAWKQVRSGVYADDEGRIVFRVGLTNDVQDKNGRYWAAVDRAGEPVASEHLGLPYEGIHRFRTLDSAKWHLEVNDQ